MRGYAGPLSFLLALLALFGGSVWLTRHPEAEIVRRAEGWPFIGRLASEVRRRYATPPPAEAGDSPVVIVDDAEPVVVEPVLPPVGEGFLWVIPGTVMRREPSANAPEIRQFDAIANVTRLEKRGDWYRVWSRGREGWVYLEGYRDDNPPYGSDPEPVKPLPSAAPDEETLATARGYLGAGARELALGPYKLYTDVGDDGLLAYFGRVASGLERAYLERYGRPPIDRVPREVVVIYASEADYREYQNRSPELLGIASGGHTATGLSVLYVGDRLRWEVASTLVHELVHTLNRRALGPALPSWLNEGLADDLASSEIAADGRVVLGSIGGHRVRSENQFTMRGAIAALWQLRDAVRTGSLIHVRELLHLHWEDFVRGHRANEHYAASAFWIRFLLEGDGGAYAEALRGYLESVSRGGPATPDALRARLGLSWNQLDARFRLWIEFQQTPTTVTSVSPS